MDIQRIQYFIKVAKYLNFTKAADECHIAQTAMSRHIANLESELDVTLFFRNNRSVSLTPAGMVFYKEAQEFLEKYFEAVNKAKGAAKGFDGSLRIGFGPYEIDLLAAPLARLKNTYPKLETFCSQNSYKGLVESLTQGFLDIIISMLCCPKVITNSVYKKIREDEFRVVINKSHPLAHKKSLTIEDLQSLDFASLLEEDGPCSPATFPKTCENMGFKPHSFVSVNSLDSKLLAVRSDQKAAMLPSFIAESLNSDFKVFTMPLPKRFPATFCVTYLPTNTNPVVRLLYDML
jgi:DNA-binding transcriptional LysR family regulator